MSKDKNDQVLMNSVYLKTFRKRKNKLLASEIDFDDDGLTPSGNIAGNSVYLETFRKRKNKLLAPEVRVAEENGMFEPDERDVEESARPAPRARTVEESARPALRARTVEESARPAPEVRIDQRKEMPSTVGKRPTDLKLPLSGIHTNELNSMNSDSNLSNDYHLSKNMASDYVEKHSDGQSSMLRSRSDISSVVLKKTADKPDGAFSANYSNEKKPEESKKSGKKRAKVALWMGIGVISVCAILLIQNQRNKSVLNDTQGVLSLLENVSDSSLAQSQINSEEVTTATATESTTATSTTAPTEETTSATAATTYRALKQGDKDEDVLNMQKRLAKLGYISENSCTGYYGEYTTKTVKRFQKKAGLKQTGAADLVTLERLYADDAPKYK